MDIAQVIDLKKVYGSGPTAVVAVKGITASIREHEFTAIMGPSGSGKSTLLHCLAGLDSITSGRVLVGGKDITLLNDNQLTRFRSEHIGFIFQAFNLIPTLTARENIMLPSQLAGKKVDAQWMEQVIEQLGLKDRSEHRPSELSGGQIQRVAVARALVSRPSLIVADEPTGNLDSASSNEVLELLRSAVDSFGQSVLMVTHDHHAASRTDRTIVMRDGLIVHDLDHPTEAELRAIV